MDIREEMKRWLAVLIDAASDSDSKLIQKDVELLLDSAGQLSGMLASRNESLRRQCRPRKASPPSPAPIKPHRTPAKPDRSDDTPSAKFGAEGRAKELSRVQQGIQQALYQRRSPMSDKQALRQQIYGPMDDDKRLRLVAKELTQ